MEGHLNWGTPVALDLFLAALGAGAFMLAVMSDLADSRKNRAVSMVGALVAPWPVIGGVLLLVADLGVPWKFWEMMLRRGEETVLESPYLQFSITSTMSIGSWVLTVFVWIALAYIAASILAFPFQWGGLLKKLVGICGLPFALAVTVYTGVLLSASPNPLWHNYLLPVTFVLSAAATGAATVIFIMSALRIVGVIDEDAAQIGKLEKLNSGILIAQLVAVILFVIVGLNSAAMLMVIGPKFGLLWWVGIIGLGLVVPLAYGFKAGVKKPQNSIVMAALVLLGGFFLRYVILVAGQVVV